MIDQLHYRRERGEFKAIISDSLVRNEAVLCSVTTQVMTSVSDELQQPTTGELCSHAQESVILMECIIPFVLRRAALTLRYLLSCAEVYETEGWY